jgi:hypothetical protein
MLTLQAEKSRKCDPVVDGAGSAPLTEEEIRYLFNPESDEDGGYAGFIYPDETQPTRPLNPAVEKEIAELERHDELRSRRGY